MKYVDWLKAVPVEITGDLLWKVEAYRLSLFLADLAWHDVTSLAKDRRTFGLSDQLYRAVGSISANISEGYSRSSGKDRARFYEYALGSARETRGWYFKSRHTLGENVSTHRIQLVTRIIRLLLTMVPDQRAVTLHEEAVPYRCLNDDALSFGEELVKLLEEAPLPALTHHASRINQPCAS